MASFESGGILPKSQQQVEQLHKWSRWSILVLLCSLPAILYAASHIEIGSASAHAWLPEGRPERTRYEQFIEAFGSDQYMVVSWEGCKINDPRLSQLKSKLLELEDPQQPIIDSIETSREIFASLLAPPLSLSARTAFDRLQGSIVGKDGTAALFIRFSPYGVAQQKVSIERVRKAADQVKGLQRSDLRMVGSIYEAFAVDEAAENSLKRLVIPSSLLGIVLAWLCLRSVRAAVAVLIIAGLGQLIAIAIVSATGGIFSAVLIVLPTLVFMLTLSAAVHFMNYYSDVAHGSRDRLGARAILLGLKPSVLATLTTSLGMIALATSQLSPVRTFGLYSATTLCIATAVLLLVFPQLADWFCQQQVLAKVVPHQPNRIHDPFDISSPVHTTRHEKNIIPVNPWATRYTSWIKQNTITISIAGISLLLFSFYGLLHLKSSTKFDDMFPKGSNTVKSMAWMENHLGPIASVEVLVIFDKESNVEPYRQIEWIDRIVKHLRQQPDIGGVIAATTFLPELPTGGTIRDVARRSIFQNEIPKTFPMLEEKGLLSERKTQYIWRLTAKVSALSKLNYGELTRKVNLAVWAVREGKTTPNLNLSEVTPAPFTAEFTGLSPIMHDTQLALLDDLGASFSTAFLLIMPVMILIARGLKAGLLIMIPNVLPETIVFGSMAWLGYSIDIAGILTASVAMGIAVNDTLHFVNWYSRRLAVGDTQEEAIADTFSNCAKAMVHTMLISCCSMLPFMFAEFNPTRQFAILMIAMMSSSILGDLVLLPALLLSPLGRDKRSQPQAGTQLSTSAGSFTPDTLSD